MADAALNEEEQQAFEAIRKDEPVPVAKDAPKPEVKAEAKAPPKDAPKESAKDEPKEQKMVPAAAVHEARQENKALKKELEQLRQTVTKGDDALKKFIEAQQRASEKPVPKFEDDPAAHLKHENDALKAALAKVNERITGEDQAKEQGSRVAQHANAVKSAEAAFAKDEPAYWKASDFVAQIWRDELLESGVDEDKVDQAVFQKALATTGIAMHKSKDPAATIWAIARRYGFKPEAPKEDAKADTKASGESKLEQITKGQEAAKTAGGGTGPDDLTFSSLAQMSDEQIDALVKDPDLWAKTVRRSPLH